MIYLKISSLLSKNDELRYIVKRKKVDESILQSEIQIENHCVKSVQIRTRKKTPYLDTFHTVNCDLICWDKNRDGGGSACYVIGDKSYPTKNYFPNEIGNICLEIS